MYIQFRAIITLPISIKKSYLYVIKTTQIPTPVIKKKQEKTKLIH